MSDRLSLYCSIAPRPFTTSLQSNNWATVSGLSQALASISPLRSARRTDRNDPPLKPQLTEPSLTPLVVGMEAKRRVKLIRDVQDALTLAGQGLYTYLERWKE